MRKTQRTPILIVITIIIMGLLLPCNLTEVKAETETSITTEVETETDIEKETTAVDEAETDSEFGLTIAESIHTQTKLLIIIAFNNFIIIGLLIALIFWGRFK